MTFPTITELPETPNRQTDNSTEFSNKTDTFLNALISFGDELNDAGDYIDSTIDDIEENASLSASSATEAEQSALEATASAQAAASSATIVGSWEDSTGSGDAFTSYTYEGSSVWMLTVDVTDITSTEPNSSNSDWVVVSRPFEAVPSPDLHIPFNDSLNIASGYGNYDQIDVSALQDGSLMIDLPSKSVDFTRSSTSNGIDKSGTLVDLPENEPSITKSGLMVHDSYTNYTLYSNSLYNFTGNGTTLTLYSDDSPFHTDCTELVETSSTGVHFFNITPQVLAEGDDLLIVFNVKAGVNAGDRNIRIGFASSNVLTNIFNVDNDGTITEASSSIGSSEYIGDGWYRLSVVLENATAGNTVCRFEMLNGVNNSYTGDGSSSFFVTGAMLTKTKTVRPLVVTDTSSETVSATSCSLPIYGNLPFRGNSFSIVIECDFPDDDEDTYTAFNISSDSSGAVILLRKIAGVVRWYHDDADGTDKTIGTFVSDYITGLNKYVLVFDADNSKFSMYCNGTFIGSNIRLNYCWFNNAGTISFPASLNSTIKSFSIYHTALSATQVASLGGAE